jgi:TRAP-type transport system small permease protein
MSASNDPTALPVIGFSELTFEEVIAALAILLIVVAVTWGVVTRYITATPAAWTTELAAIAFSWAVFLGSAAAFKRGEHITFDMHVSAWPVWARRIVEVVSDLVVFATLLVVATLSINFTISTWDVPSTLLRLPQGLIYAGAAVGFTLMTLRHSVAAVQRLRDLGVVR